MIQLNELRIGNLIYINEVAREVSAIEPYGVTFQYIDVHVDTGYAGFENITPITITEEWLLKAGFEKHTSNPFWFKNGIVCISVLWKVELITWDNQRIALENEVNYVHQLQNLYFALTGKELEFKL